MIDKDHFCSACGSDVIQRESDGCNQPFFYECCICNETREGRNFPKTFPKRFRIKEQDFAEFYIDSDYTQYDVDGREACKMFLLDNKTKEEKTP